MSHPVERIPVTSRQVLSYGYCENCQGLYVEFQGHRLYKYAPVTPDEWKALRMTASKGSWIHHRLKVTQRPYQDLGTDQPMAVAANAG